MMTVANTTIKAWSSEGTVEPAYDYFESQVKLLQTALPGYYSSFQQCEQYLWMRLEQGLIKDAITAMAVSLALAFIIIFLSTTDLLLSLTSTAVISTIVLIIIANLVWIGWKVSVLESICLTVLVGLSVDYTIHLANAWQTASTFTDRLQRLRATVLEIGISVLAASMTTFLACLPLFATIVVFFYKFGVFIALTVVWSTLAAFGLFLTLMAMYGRVVGRNDLYWFWLALTGGDRTKSQSSWLRAHAKRRTSSNRPESVSEDIGQTVLNSNSVAVVQLIEF